jgi:hypothetical protein
VVSVTDLYGHILGFLDRSSRFFFQVVLTRLNGPRSRPTSSQKIWKRRESNPDLRICSQELWSLEHTDCQFSHNRSVYWRYVHRKIPSGSQTVLELLLFSCHLTNVTRFKRGISMHNWHASTDSRTRTQNAVAMHYYMLLAESPLSPWLYVNSSACFGPIRLSSGTCDDLRKLLHRIYCSMKQPVGYISEKELFKWNWFLLK